MRRPTAPDRNTSGVVASQSMTRGDRATGPLADPAARSANPRSGEIHDSTIRHRSAPGWAAARHAAGSAPRPPGAAATHRLVRPAARYRGAAARVVRALAGGGVAPVDRAVIG